MAKEYDPSMHTAEHVLNQTMIRLFGAGRSFSAHLNRGKSKCDYRFARDLTNEEAEFLEAEVNKMLDLDLPVVEEFVPLAEAAQIVNIAKLPPEALADPEGRIRLVRIGYYDICPCIGAHVATTGQASPFRLVSHSFTAPDVLRLRFKAG
jgi:Ser-tRNA(Ala) deacylase AlaX